MIRCTKTYSKTFKIFELWGCIIKTSNYSKLFSFIYDLFLGEQNILKQYLYIITGKNKFKLPLSIHPAFLYKQIE